MKNGISISQYLFSHSMKDDMLVMYSADSDMLIVPQTGTLLITTEMGLMSVGHKEICVIPRGVKFQVNCAHGSEGSLHRGWIAEIFKGHFVIPDLGPIGANGCANERDF
jgi:homogentisate 1,2-dioxygenase